MFCAWLALVSAGIISLPEALAGFSNEGMLTVAILYVIAAALQNTGILDLLNSVMLGARPSTERVKLSRLLFPTSIISGFLNNTPIVSMLLPSVKNWAEKNNFSASRFLLPLSYATILGGMCTLIGTSTNLVSHGLLVAHGLPGFTFFEFVPVALPAAVTGLLFIVLVGVKLLPKRTPPTVTLGEHTREFVVEFKLSQDYPFLGKTIEEAGLRHLRGLYLFQIEREGEAIAPAASSEKLRLNDRLFFTGLPKTILELQKTPGLELTPDSHFDLKHYDSDVIKTFEAVISASSSLAGKNVRESNFRKKYGAVIVAIHRNGERVEKKIGDIELKAGDTLLLLGDRDFRLHWYHSTEFCLISNTEEIPSKSRKQAILSVATFLIMAGMAALGWLPLIVAMGVAAVVLVLGRSITSTDAIQAIDYKTLLMIICSFGIAKALENSGVCEYFADWIMGHFSAFGPFGMIIALYLITATYTNFITNNAAAILMIPLAISIAAKSGLDVHAFAIVTVMGANSSFSTPMSYQTNLMVYGPGGYRFTDYLRVGIPLQAIVGTVLISMIYVIYF
ncbi:MAG: SLC13 family permease [Bacteroidetes bacterium]|nr:SLC13 family permease [Bacteroidota bacterium]